jgi:hypothetical protein
MVKAKVLQAITHLGVLYTRGDEITVDHATANQLIAAGCITVPVAPSPDAAAAVRASGPIAPPKAKA